LNILELAVLSKNHYEKLLKFGITDVNFAKNSSLIIDLFLKKKFFENANLVESIILYELQTKAELSEHNLLFTLGPNKIFKGIFLFFESVNDVNLFSLMPEFLAFTNKIIIQYLSSIDFVIRVINYLFVIYQTSHCDFMK